MSSMRPGKRKRSPDDSSEELDTENHSSSESFSIEALLAVPLNLIFTPSRRNPLLTRTEAQFLIRITQLAQEMDVLVRIAADALAKRRDAAQFEHRIVKKNPFNHYLRSVVPLLAVHGGEIPSSVFNYVGQETDRILNELTHCSASFKQFAEQNWTLADSLLEALEGTGSGVAPHLVHEKRMLAEMEEEVAGRIDQLASMTTSLGTCMKFFAEEFDTECASPVKIGTGETMRDFCLRLAPEQEKAVEVCHPNEKANSAGAVDHVDYSTHDSLSSMNPKKKETVETPNRGESIAKKSGSDDDSDADENVCSLTRSSEKNNLIGKQEDCASMSVIPTESVDNAAVALAELAGLSSPRK